MADILMGLIVVLGLIIYVCGHVRECEHFREDRKGRWIPVTERLPEINQPCLCYKKAHGEDGYKLGTYLGASFSKECAAFRSMSHYGCIGATHWMPLPEPPKGE